jgi:cobalt-zinc-cadmium efflux system outer membrane protein
MRSSLATICACACLASVVTRIVAAEPTALEKPQLLPPAEYVALRQPEALPPARAEREGLTLEAVEELALAANPALAEAQALVRAARGWAYQVGLPPNPTIGYAGSEIGNDGAAGQQGLVIGQEFIRGNKLGLNRAVESREVFRLEQHFAAQRYRVLTDVRTAFYQAYLAERRVELSRALQVVGSQSVATAQARFDAQEAPRTDLLQAEIEGQRANMDLAQAESNLRGAWRRLAAAVGQPDLPIQPLAAEVDAREWPLAWDATLVQLWGESPEVSTAMAEIEKARCALARARVESVPDVTAQASIQYDDATNDAIAGAQITFPIPLWNRNQGGVARALGELTAAQRRLDMVELRLQGDLAAEYQAYETALTRTTVIRNEILGRAQETLDAATHGYQAGELDFLAFLTVQRTYFQANLEYLTALGELYQSVEMLRGLLLSGSYRNTEVLARP